MRVIIFWLSILATFITLSFLKSNFFIIGVIIMMIMYLVDILGKDNNNSIGLSLIPYKKVYTEWGTFYIKLVPKGSDGYVVNIWEKRGLIFHLLDDFEYRNIEDMKTSINYYVEKHCGERKRIRDKKKNIKKEIFKNWNGSTTKELDRDRKLQSIIN